MKKLIMALMMVGVFGFVPVVFAAPNDPNKAANNPQVVAYYPTGDHGIVGEPYLHQGVDLVMLAGKSGNLQQWFTGTSAEPGDIVEGDHSIWRNIGSSTQVPNGWVLMVDPYPEWGDYLVPGANYAVKTNDFAAK